VVGADGGSFVVDFDLDLDLFLVGPVDLVLVDPGLVGLLG
jgi:hypothetical protein